MGGDTLCYQEEALVPVPLWIFNPLSLSRKGLTLLQPPAQLGVVCHG